MNKKRYIKPRFVEMDARSMGYYMTDDPMFAVSMEEEGTIHAKETDDEWEEFDDDWDEWE